MEFFGNLDPSQVSELFVQYGTKFAGFVVTVIATLVIAGWVRGITQKSALKAKVDAALASFLSKMAKYAVLAVGLISALGIFGIETASFAAVLAAAGFAVGMALQGTLGNFASGVMILLFKPFKPGQFISVGGTSGTVAEIDLFSTMLDTPDNRRIIVPNGAVFGSQIENVSHHATRRVDVLVGSDYSADLDKTRSVLLAAAKRVEHALTDPAPVAVLTGLGDSSVNWAVRIWVQAENYWPAMDQLTEYVKKDLDSAGIGIPFPQMELNLPNGFTAAGLSGKSASSENRVQ
ncbi:MAG: mechanosensitive ion channel domain-containing protein [Pseudomonadota bacterium]